MEKKLRRSSRTGMLILALTCALVCALTLLLLIGRRYDYALGSVAHATIYAPRTIVDTVSTNAQRDAARAAVAPVYSMDLDMIRAQNAKAESFFVSIHTIRGNVLGDAKRTAAEWAKALSAEEKSKYAHMTDPQLTEEQLCAVLAAQEKELELLKQIVEPKLSVTLSKGLTEATAAGALDDAIREIRAVSGLSEAVKSVGETVLRGCVQPTYAEDTEATELARREAAAQVEDVRVRVGAPIVREGESVTRAQLAMLEELDMVRSQRVAPGKYIGAGLCIVLSFALYMLCLADQSADVLRDQKKTLMLCVTLFLSFGLYALTRTLSMGISTGLIAVLLCAALLSARVAMLTGLLLGFVMSVASGGQGVLMQPSAYALFVGAVVSSVVAVLSLRRTYSRNAYILSGAVGAFAGALGLFFVELAAGTGWLEALGNGGCFALSGTICAVLVVGLLPVWEKLFDAATPARLHELLGANEPLLRQLMSEAPGTYQHSMNVAALSEAAAQRIGADPLLARAGAVYHDIGKLRRPLYFAENQVKGENIHDTLPPQESAACITAHPRDGVAYLNKAGGKGLFSRKFPSAVVRIVSEHHGNSLVAYFYYKALKTDPNVEQKDFRYTGGKPSSKESAIVMLADSCEAAVRSLGDHTQEAREDMVHKVIWGKMNDGGNNLLSDVPLSFKQLGQVERSFLRTFNGIMHDRIEYPEETEDTQA